MKQKIQIEDALEEALQMRRRGISVDEILAKFPEHKSELSDLLLFASKLDSFKPNVEPGLALRKRVGSITNSSSAHKRSFVSSLLASFISFIGSRALAPMLAVAVLAVLAVSSGLFKTEETPHSPESVSGLSQEITTDSVAFSSDEFSRETGTMSLNSSENQKEIVEHAFSSSRLAEEEAELFYPITESYIAEEISMSQYEEELSQF